MKHPEQTHAVVTKVLYQVEQMQQKTQKGRFTESKTKEENVKCTNQETRQVTGGKTDNSQ